MPARWKGSSNDLGASSLMESLQVPDGDKPAAVVDAVEDEPFSARPEVPLATRSGVDFMQCNAVRRVCATAIGHDHGGQEK